jgi:hypothetical protein
MKHRTRPAAARHRPATRPARPHTELLRWIAASAVLLCVTLLAIWLAPGRRDDRALTPEQAQAAGKSWKVGMLRPDGLRLVASGREDASQVLDPERFTDPAVKRGYSIAAQIPRLLNQLYCWCGCEDRGAHRSSLQCFEDLMATDCPVCLGTAEIAHEMSRKGIAEPAAVQAAVDAVWGFKR